MSDFWRLMFSDTIETAKTMLGMALYLDDIYLGRIVETEAYLGAKDSACHSANGKRTPKNEAMYLSAGHWYVYAMHTYWLLNLVTRDEGIAEAVLIRALEVHGEVVQANGPGKLTRLTQITKEFNGQSIKASRLTIRPDLIPRKIEQRARIGITCTDYWKDEPLCFYVAGSRHVSKIRKKGLLIDENCWQ